MDGYATIMCATAPTFTLANSVDVKYSKDEMGQKGKQHTVMR